MNYTVCYFEAVELDCVELFEFLKQGFSKYRFELDSIVEFSQVECRTVERAICESDLVWELPRLLAYPHADLHAEFFFGRDEGYADRECKIPAVAITADFRLMTTSEGLTVCIISAPGDLYYEPNWSAPAKFFEFSLSAIVESLVSQFSIRIIDKRSPHLTPDYCLQLARSYASMEMENYHLLKVFVVFPEIHGIIDASQILGP